jgi:predicted secreted hydrolase
VDARGHTQHLASSDFRLTPSGESWSSSASEAKYPVSWTMEIPKLALHLEATTRLKSQELVGGGPLSPNYWEGAITIRDRKAGGDLSGVGYLEMTGYDRPIEMGR